MSTWILVANASTAKLFSTENVRTKNLNFVKELDHPASRQKELLSDRSGNYRNEMGSAVTSSYEKKITPKQMEAEYFAEELVKEIVKDYNEKKFADFILIAPAHFHALIKKHLHRHIVEKLHIDKDYTKYTAQQLEAAIKEHLLA